MPLALNQSCHCISLDEAALQRHFDAALQQEGSLPGVLLGREHLFAHYPVFASRVQLAAMQSGIAAALEVMALPGFQADALANTAWPDQHTGGVLMGFDFHPEPAGAKLIEINTNAGGAYLTALLTQSQRACCSFAGELLAAPASAVDAPAAWLNDFLNEWRLARGERPLRRVVIVDDQPAQQFLYPEFLLFRNLFRRHAISCEIADPADLRFDGTQLLHGLEPVDLVYNRLTDFSLGDPRHAALRDAYLGDAVVVTPAPRHHALYADKRHLVRLSDDAYLERIGATESARQVLRNVVPPARLVTAASAAEIWGLRKRYFFKPFAGHGSRGAYRGDRITHRVWDEIVASDGYIAQEFAAPPTRRGTPDSTATPLKFDVRCVSYGNALRLVSARLYQGQTTNLRTASGGLGSVFLPAMLVRSEVAA